MQNITQIVSAVPRSPVNVTLAPKVVNTDTTTRPTFGVDIPAYNCSEKQLKTMPAHVVGTFYDLLGPDLKEKGSKKEEGEGESLNNEEAELSEQDKKEKALAKGKKNSFTYSALTATFCTGLFNAITKCLPADLHSSEVKAENLFSRNSIFSEFYRSGKISDMADKISVKKVGTNWEIKLPIFLLDFGNVDSSFFRYLFTDAVLNSPDDWSMYRGKLRDNFFPLITSLKAHGWNFTSTGLQGFDVQKSQVGPSVPKGYSIANNFYTKYVKNFRLEPLKTQAKQTFFDENGTEIEDIKDAVEDNTRRKIETHIFSRIYTVFAVVTLPGKEAEYYVQTPERNITPAQMVDFFFRWQKGAFKTQLKSWPTFSHSNKTIINKNRPFTPKPRNTNLGLVLLKSNLLWYIPNDVNFLEAYDQAYDDLISDPNNPGEFCVAENATEDKKKLVRNQLWYVDWINNKLLLTGNDYNLLVADLETCHKANENSIIWQLNYDITGTMDDNLMSLLSLGESLKKHFSVEDNLSHYMRSTEFQAAMDAARSVNNFAAQTYFSRMYIGMNSSMADYFKSVIGYMSSIHGELKENNRITLSTQWASLRVALKEFTETNSNPMYVPIARYIQRMHSEVMQDPVMFINSIEEYPLKSLRNIAVLVCANQAESYATIQQKDRAERKPYLDQDIKNPNDKVDPNYIPSFKNSEGLPGLQPHQAKVLNVLGDHPKSAIIGVQAGGGKTILTIEDILKSLEDGVVTRPLVLCPANLIKDYVAEVNFVTKGKVNVIGLDTDVYRRYAWIKETPVTGEMDFTKLKALFNAAPINTIWVSGYDVYSKSGNKISAYGGGLIYSNSYINFLRSCGFDGVWCDESHFLKDPDSNRVKAIEQLISEIPYKRLLTGTLAPNTLVDLVKQSALMNPGILGSKEQFYAMFANSPEDAKFSAKPGSQDQIKNLIKQNCVYINVQRKEWASNLPRLHEHFITAHLTTNQRKVYGELINELVQEIDSNAVAKKALNAKTTGESPEEDKVENVFDNSVNNLSLVEAFLSSPMSAGTISEEYLLNSADLNPADPNYAEERLDRISPKGRVIWDNIIKPRLEEFKRYEHNYDGWSKKDKEEKHEIEQERIDNSKFPGKVLVFCNTHASVEGILSAIPEDEKKYVLHYLTEFQTEHEHIFKTDPKIRVLVGISKSLETGLNLQMADTLVRTENVWSPGVFEQGMSRINRPNMKDDKGDFRMKNGIHVYYVMVDQTIDTLKMAKLTAKTVELAKFYNAGTKDASYYADIGLDDEGNPLKPMDVSFANLRAAIEGLKVEDIQPYLDAFSYYRSAEQRVYDEYLAEQGGTIKKVQVRHTGLLKDSKFLINIPYTAGMSFFDSSKLGLTPYPEFKRNWMLDPANKDEEWGERTFTGIAVHTEEGDGIIEKCTRNTVHVRLRSGVSQNADGPKLIVDNELCFVIGKEVTSAKQIRHELAVAAGLQPVEVDVFKSNDLETKEEKNVKKSAAQIALEEKRALKQKAREKREADKEKKRALRERRRAQREREEEKVRRTQPTDAVRRHKEEPEEVEEDESNKLNVHMLAVNDTFTLLVSSDDAKAEAPLFKKYGFQYTKPYWFAELRQAKTLDGFLDRLNELDSQDKIEVPSEYFEDLDNLLAEFRQSRGSLLKVHQKPKSEIRHFLMERRRRMSNPKEVHPMPLILDGKLYVCLDTGIHSTGAINIVKKIKLPGMKWEEEKGGNIMGFYSSKSDVKQVLLRMEHDGWEIENKKELIHEFNQIKMRGRK